MGTTDAGLRSGALLGSRYELLNRIGRGGQGEAWIARDRLGERRVVVKIRSIPNARDRDVVVSEARILLDLPPHPRIPTVRDDFFEEDRYCLVMDWIEGRSLAQILIEEGTPGLSFERVAPWMAQVADALDHLHAHVPPVFHGDVKLHNIVVTEDGRAVLVDFALAGSHADRGRRGTPAYLAPEITDGYGPSIASDVYALAVTAYAAITGAPPDPGLPPDLSTVPNDRRTIVRDAFWKALAIEPLGRHASAGEFANAFTDIARRDPRYVGRRDELDSLTSALAHAVGGRGRTVLVTGEGGIGKTALLTVFARAAAATGARVVWGRCWEGSSSPAYLPWAQVAGALTHDASYAVTAALEPYATYLASLVPALARGTQRTSDDITLLFDSVVQLLRAVARERPLVVLIDDLHLTDRSSARLLAHVIDHIRDAPIALVVACRERDARADARLGSLLDDLMAHEQHLAIEGLGIDELRALVNTHHGRPVTDSDLDRLRDATRGNPFFVNELVRLDLAAGPSASVPENLREAVRRRLSLLPADTRTALRVASVAGRSFELEAIADATSSHQRELTSTIAHAIRQGVLDRSESVGSYVFTHDVFRESLYEDIDPDERATLHATIGHAIESSDPATDDREVVAKLAFHFTRAAHVGEGRRAIRYLNLAGRQAFRQMAYDEAIAMYERGLSLLETGTTPMDPEEHCSLVIELGVAELAAGRPSAEQTLAEGAEIALALGSGSLLARAATCRPIPFGRVVPERRAMVENALLLIGEEPTTQRAELLSGLGLMLSYGTERERGIELCAEALRIARLLRNDVAIHGTRTNLMFARSGPDRLDERLRTFSGLEESVVSARGAYAFTFERQIEIAALIEAADITGINRALADAETMTTLHIDPYAAWALEVFKAMHAILRGDFDAADSLAAEALRLGELARSETALINYAAQLAIMRREQGRLEEIEPLLAGFIEQFPDLVAWRYAVVVLLLELGRTDDARDEFECAAAEGFASIPRDATWLSAMELLCEACAGLGDIGRAREVMPLLEPYAERVPTPSGAVALPPVAFGLGLLARTLNDVERAVAYFAQAMEIAVRMGGRPWEPRINLEWAHAVARNDPHRARKLVRTSAAVAGELGMRTLVARAAELEAELAARG
jgi:serine/threonine protein kinase/tetratricopeptide (TPR) repeat protein